MKKKKKKKLFFGGLKCKRWERLFFARISPPKLPKGYCKIPSYSEALNPISKNKLILLLGTHQIHEIGGGGPRNQLKRFP